MLLCDYIQKDILKYMFNDYIPHYGKEYETICEISGIQYDVSKYTQMVPVGNFANNLKENFSYKYKVLIDEIHVYDIISSHITVNDCKNHFCKGDTIISQNYALHKDVVIYIIQCDKCIHNLSVNYKVYKFQ
jgi:hypothetical protein